MPDFAKRFREQHQGKLYSMPMKLFAWERLEVMGQPAPRPTEDCVGFMMVFDNDKAAREWADGGAIVHLNLRDTEEARG